MMAMTPQTRAHISPGDVAKDHNDGEGKSETSVGNPNETLTTTARLTRRSPSSYQMCVPV